MLFNNMFSIVKQIQGGVLIIFQMFPTILHSGEVLVQHVEKTVGKMHVLLLESE